MVASASVWNGVTPAPTLGADSLVILRLTLLRGGRIAQRRGGQLSGCGLLPLLLLLAALLLVLLGAVGCSLVLLLVLLALLLGRGHRELERSDVAAVRAGRHGVGDRGSVERAQRSALIGAEPEGGALVDRWARRGQGHGRRGPSIRRQGQQLRVHSSQVRAGHRRVDRGSRWVPDQAERGGGGVLEIRRGWSAVAGDDRVLERGCVAGGAIDPAADVRRGVPGERRPDDGERSVRVNAPGWARQNSVPGDRRVPDRGGWSHIRDDAAAADRGGVAGDGRSLDEERAKGPVA